MIVTGLCWECGEELDPEVPEAHVCWEQHEAMREAS